MRWWWGVVRARVATCSDVSGFQTKGKGLEARRKLFTTSMPHNVPREFTTSQNGTGDEPSPGAVSTYRSGPGTNAPEHC